MNRIGIVLAAALALGGALAHPAAAQRSEEFHWEGVVAAGKTVTVRGLNGGIEARPATGPSVEVVAMKEGRRSDPGQVRIDVRETGDGVTICPVYPGDTGCAGEGRGRRGRENDVKVEFTLRVPAGVHLDARTVNGGIEAHSLTGDVRASTVNGGISVAASGAVEASTVNGSIDARSGRARWSGEIEFRTVNGSIEVTLPEGVGAEVEASTVNGSLSTDFPLTIQAGRIWGPRKMEGTIGGGGGTLRLETVNGPIRLRRS